MPVILCFTSPDGIQRPTEEFCVNSTIVGTSADPKQADALQGSTKAKHVSGSGDGEVTATARLGGTVGHLYSVAHAANESGNPNEPITFSFSGLGLTIAFGTNGAGESVTPTAQQLSDAANADEAAVGPAPDFKRSRDRFTFTAGGDGSGLVAIFGLVSLAGGLDDGDYYRYGDGILRRICSVEVI